MGIDSDKAYIVVHWNGGPDFCLGKIINLSYSYSSAKKCYLEKVKDYKDEVKYGVEWLYLFKIPLSWIDEYELYDLVDKESEKFAKFIQDNIMNVDIEDSTILGEKK